MQRDIEGTISIGPWGGRGGSPWSYMTNRGINQIVIHVGSNIKSISFRDTTGLDSATFGGENPNDIGERKTVSIPPCGVLSFLIENISKGKNYLRMFFCSLYCQKILKFFRFFCRLHLWFINY
jgi:hypothetical protein